MHLSRSLILPLFLIALSSLSAQQTSQETKLPSPQRDPEALALLSQALAAAGGEEAIRAVNDYTASGRFTFYQSKDEQIPGTVTLNGRGYGQFRMDTDLPDGRRSNSITEGRTTTKDIDGTISTFPPERPVPSSDASPRKAPLLPNGLILPSLQLRFALRSAVLNVTYKGLVELEGRQAHHIQLQRPLPRALAESSRTLSASWAQSRMVDVFIDSSTLQVLLTQEMFPNNVLQRVRYSDYRSLRRCSGPLCHQGGKGWTEDLGDSIAADHVQLGLAGCEFRCLLRH